MLTSWLTPRNLLLNLLIVLPAVAAEPRIMLETTPPEILTTLDREDEFPAVGCDADGRIYVAWVSYDGRQDGVWVRDVAAANGAGRRLSGTATDCWRPAMARDGEGRLWVTWAQNNAGNWDLFASSLQGNRWSDPTRLTTNPGNDFGQQIVADQEGRLWLAWQAVVEDNYEILLAQLTADGLGEPENVSQNPANDWDPAIAVDALGTVFVAWDSYRHGSYDILVARRSSDDHLGQPQLIAASQDYEAHAALAVDRENRLWIAWDNGGPHWGQHGEARRKLHTSRTLHLCCLDGSRLLQPVEDLGKVLTPAMRSFLELPELCVDGAGRLWLFARHLEDLTPPGKRRVGGQLRSHQSRGVWNPLAFCYANGVWSQPLKLPDSNGRNDMRLATCLDSAGHVWAAWADDGRKPTRAEEPVNHQVHAARIEHAVATTAPLATSPTARNLPSPQPIPLSRASRPTYDIDVAGTTYTLLYGDTHRHTDISRCGMNADGSLIDTYRYAIDAAGLDFLAVSDHDQDLLKHRYERVSQGPLQNYAWWRSQKYCDLFHMPDRFLAIYGYEHGGSFKSRGGHKNVLYAQRGMPCFEEDSPAELFSVLRGKEAVVIPHQLADGGSATDWGKWNAEFERVAEIFQARGSYEFFGAPLVAPVEREGHYLQDALGGGVQIGVIASSDHGLVHGAYAGVFARHFTRQGVLEALRNRRSFGATEMMVLDLRLETHVMGEEVRIAGQPTFRATALGVKPLERVEVVRDGNIVYSTTPDQTRCSFRFTDVDLPAGTDAYYYLRSQQEDDQWAWSSAIWVQRTR